MTLQDEHEEVSWSVAVPRLTAACRTSTACASYQSSDQHTVSEQHTWAGLVHGSYPLPDPFTPLLETPPPAGPVYRHGRGGDIGGERRRLRDLSDRIAVLAQDHPRGATVVTVLAMALALQFVLTPRPEGPTPVLSDTGAVHASSLASPGTASSPFNLSAPLQGPAEPRVPVTYPDLVAGWGESIGPEGPGTSGTGSTWHGRSVDVVWQLDRVTHPIAPVTHQLNP